MRQLVVGVIAGVFLLSTGVGTATAQPTKSVSGTVTAVGPDSVTVKVKDQDMKFAVDKTTEVIARGGSTAEHAAKAEGKTGPAISTLLKAGQSVEVKYHEAAMHAANIRVLPGAAAAPTAAGRALGNNRSGVEGERKTEVRDGLWDGDLDDRLVPDGEDQRRRIHVRDRCQDENRRHRPRHEVERGRRGWQEAGAGGCRRRRRQRGCQLSRHGRREAGLRSARPQEGRRK